MTKSFENDSDTNHGLNSQRKPEDASFMREAIRLSQLAVEHGNEPFGAVLVKNGFVIPILVKERIRSYELSEFTRDHETEIMKMIGSGKRRSSK